jgi:hypothetical protein
VQSALADPHDRRAWRPARTLVALVCVVLLTALAGGCSKDTSIAPPAPPSGGAAAQAHAAQQVLARLAAAVRDHDPDAGARLGAGDGATLTRAVVTNAAALGVHDLRLDYVDSAPGALTDDERRHYGSDAQVAAVRVGFRLPADANGTNLEVAFTFRGRGDQTRIAAIGGHDDRSPLWLTAPVHVVRAGRATVIDAGPGSPARTLRLARRAVVAVNRVLPSWRGNLVVEVPRDEAQLDLVLDAKQQTYANIAAVTTTVDGSLAPGSPIHVFLNPRVFGTLRADGAQVVLSHETTHVATRAPLADMPTWLLEGFADYVALAHAGVPVRVAAGQIIARIRTHGPPRRLPTATDLQPTATGLGATYEEAWLACRYLATTYGERRLVAFYRAVDGGTDVDRAFRSVVGVSRAAFVAGWRKDLARLAG